MSGDVSIFTCFVQNMNKFQFDPIKHRRNELLHLTVLKRYFCQGIDQQTALATHTTIGNQLIKEIVEFRGWPGQQTVSDFLASGYSESQILEVVLGVGMKTLSNYTNHLAGTELDPALPLMRGRRNNLATTLAFDVYGTLIDTHGVTEILKRKADTRVIEFSHLA